MRIYPEYSAHAGVDLGVGYDEPENAMDATITIKGYVVRPLDWVIAALAAAFIAAGVVVLLPLGGDTPVVASAPVEAPDRPKLTDLSEEADRPDLRSTVSDTPAAPKVDQARISQDEPVEEAAVRIVKTETITLSLATEEFSEDPTVAAIDEPIGGPTIIEGVGATQPDAAPLVLASFDVNDSRVPVGCGMTLTELGDQSQNLFYHQLPSADGASQAFVIIDNRPVAMNRTAVDGDPLGYGQFPVQTFETPDKAVSAIVEVEFKPFNADSESLQVEAGRLIVTHADGRAVTVPVAGDAGC